MYIFHNIHIYLDYENIEIVYGLWVMVCATAPGRGVGLIETLKLSQHFRQLDKIGKFVETKYIYFFSNNNKVIIKDFAW